MEKKWWIVIIVIALLGLFFTSDVFEESVLFGPIDGIRDNILRRADGWAEPKTQLNLELTVATLKDEYVVGEDVDLTDPPGGGGVEELVVDSAPNVLTGRSVNSHIPNSNQERIDEIKIRKLKIS